MKLLMLFIVLNILNTVLQTTEKLMVVKCGKVASALFSAVCFGFYTVVIVYTMCELPLLVKAFVVAICQFTGVFTVKLIEQKIRSDKLWKVEFVTDSKWKKAIEEYLEECKIEYSSIPLESQIIYNIYCETQVQSLKVKNMVETYQGRYFVSESKSL